MNEIHIADGKMPTLEENAHIFQHYFQQIFKSKKKNRKRKFYVLFIVLLSFFYVSRVGKLKDILQEIMCHCKI